ncbi:MAG TPA: hypothetical protein VK168_11840 [Saprospiraceae bacterium]|nr:hypothetical protein [Saprospiraceae bacterium]
MFKAAHFLKHVLYLLLAGLIACFCSCQKKTGSTSGTADKPVRYVAYVGFNAVDTTKARANNYSDSLHILALNAYLQAFNQKDYGAEFQLKVFQCDFREDTIPAIYEAIRSDSTIALVIDNTWGRHIRHAASVIKGNIPVIAMTADQNRLDFGLNALFLDPNDPQPFYLIQFIQKVLEAPKIGFITESDYLLHQKFAGLIQEHDLPCDTLIKILQADYVNNNEVPKKHAEALERNLLRVLSQPEPRVILLNTHSGYGNLVMRFLQKTKGLPPKTIIGLPGVTNIGDQELEQITRERGHTIIRFDNSSEALPLELHLFKKELAKQNAPKFFNTRNTDNTLRRCFDAMNIFETAILAGCWNRSDLIHYFQHLRERKITILNELYEFDSTCILKKEPTFSQTQSGKTRSCPTQINTSGTPIPNLRVGIDVIDINEIDVRKNTFDCNLLYWVIADEKYIDKEGYVDFDNISSEEANRYRIAEERDSNYVVRIYRISGKFLGQFETFDFPFDHHEVKIPITALSSSDKIKISFDYSRLQIKDKKKDFYFNDWSTDEYFVTLDNQLTNALGSLDKITFDTLDRAKYLEKYKSLNLRLQVSRRPWGSIILIIVPFLMFSALPIFMLIFHRANFEEVGELIITSFLATVAYSINLTQLSPTTDSMNRAYLFLLLTLGINFFCFLYVTYFDQGRASRNAQGERVKRRFRLRKVWVPLLLFLVFLTLMFFIFG